MVKLSFFVLFGPLVNAFQNNFVAAEFGSSSSINEQVFSFNLIKNNRTEPFLRLIFAMSGLDLLPKTGLLPVFRPFPRPKKHPSWLLVVDDDAIGLIDQN